MSVEPRVGHGKLVRGMDAERQIFGENIDNLVKIWRAAPSSREGVQKKGTQLQFTQSSEQKVASEAIAQALQEQIRKLAYRFAQRYNLTQYTDDLISECNVALLYALRSFEPSKIKTDKNGQKHDFLTHFTVLAINHMQRFSKTVRGPIRLPEEVYAVKSRVQQFLTEHPGKSLEQACAAVANDKHMEPDTVIAMIQILGAHFMSTSEPHPHDSGARAHWLDGAMSSAQDNIHNPDAELWHARLQSFEVWLQSTELSKRDKYIVKQILSGKKYTEVEKMLKDLAQENKWLPITHQRIQQIVQSIIDKYKQFINSEKLR